MYQEISQNPHAARAAGRLTGRLILTIALIPLAFSTACAFLRGYSRAPEVSIVNLEFTRATPFETLATFEIRIDNENTQNYDFSGAVHRLYLNGVQVGKGFDKEFSLPALSSTTRKIDVSISHLSLLTRINSLLNEDDLVYRIESTLHPTGALLSSIDTKQTGKLELSPFQSKAGDTRRFRPSTDFEPDYQKNGGRSGFFVD